MVAASQRRAAAGSGWRPGVAMMLLHMLLTLSAPAAPVHREEPAPLRRPNILLFFPDELRYDWGGLHNNPYYSPRDLPIYTPHFDTIAKQGVRFTRAFVGAPVCAPSRACLASGRQYDQNTVRLISSSVDFLCVEMEEGFLYQAVCPATGADELP